MSESPYGRGLSGLLKKGFHEIPGVMGTSVYALMGLGMFGFVIYHMNTYGMHPSKYKQSYIVVRPDDPRVNRPVNSYPQ